MIKIKPTECVITVFAGKEEPEINAFLNTVKMEDSSNGKFIVSTAKVTGIHGESTCPSEKEFTSGEFITVKEGLIFEEVLLS